MFEPYLMGQYQYPWQGMPPTPNWQPQTPQVAQGQANLQLQASNNAAAISQQLATCCCETQRAIDGVNYNAAQNTASINANTTAAVQKVLVDSYK